MVAKPAVDPWREFKLQRATHKRLLRDDPAYRRRQRRILWLTLLYLAILLPASLMTLVARLLFNRDMFPWDVLIGVPATVIASGLYAYAILRDGIWMRRRMRHEITGSDG